MKFNIVHCRYNKLLNMIENELKYLYKLRVWLIYSVTRIIYCNVTNRNLIYKGTEIKLTRI